MQLGLGTMFSLIESGISSSNYTTKKNRKFQIIIFEKIKIIKKNWKKFLKDFERLFELNSYGTFDFVDTGSIPEKYIVLHASLQDRYGGGR